MGQVTPPDGSLVYLDANVLIYASESPSTFPSLPRLLNRVGLGRLSAVTSELTLAETLVLPFRTGNAAVAAAYQAQLTTGAGLTVVEVTRAVLLRAAALRAATPSVKLPDAIHAATAFLTACSLFLTNDGRLRSVPNLPVLLLGDLA